MTDVKWDQMIRQSLPPVDITAERLERFVTQVMDNLPPQARPVPVQPRPSWRERLAVWLPMPRPALAFGLPLVMAGWLGVVVGNTLMPPPKTETPWTSQLSTTTSPLSSWGQ